MADGVAHGEARDDVRELSPIDRIVQANRAYYDAWRTSWAEDRSGVGGVKDTSVKSDELGPDNLSKSIK